MFIALTTFAVPLAVLRVRILFPKPRAVVGWAAFTDAPFMLFTLAVVIIFIGQTVLLFYISFSPANRAFTSQSVAFSPSSTLGRSWVGSCPTLCRTASVSSTPCRHLAW